MFNIVALPEAPWSELAFQFVVLNKSAAKVDDSLLINIIGNSLTDAERNSFKSSVAGIQAEIVKELGGESQKIYDLLLKGKEEYKKKK